MEGFTTCHPGTVRRIERPRQSTSTDPNDHLSKTSQNFSDGWFHLGIEIRTGVELNKKKKDFLKTKKNNEVSNHSICLIEAYDEELNYIAFN
mmetsp:Transcript_55628/g.134848  ORF Transcript_55628/g.134848 Transcript_55628/m.134848 type:complete len:92 (-) Transcript_55628:581-856(-)